MDEIFGYIPPVSEPPSKRPLLTLLKQARAYGVGIVLATQNPVDIDYRALSNIGTWFVGRLQTDRDRERVLDGLAGSSAAAAAGFDKKSLNGIVSDLGKRVFLMHNIHEGQPAVFHTRWAMSYLSGPLTRAQIRQLAKPNKEADAPAGASDRGRRRTPAIPAGVTDRSDRPVLPPGIPEGFLAPDDPIRRDPVYSPGLLGIADVHFVHGRSGPEHTETIALWTPIDSESDAVDWQAADILDIGVDDIEKAPLPDASFRPLSSKASRRRSFAGWRRKLIATLYRNQRYELFKSGRFKMVSKPGESERDFRIRLSNVARETRDFAVEKLRKKFTARTRTIEDRIRRAELAVDREKEQAKHQKLQTAISFGATMLSAFLGRKRTGRATLGRATTTARGVGRAAKEARDIERARARLDTLKKQLDTLQTDFEAEADRLEEHFDPETEILETITLKPRKKDIEIRRLTLTWAPEP
jgi:hypothetical protein